MADTDHDQAQPEALALATTPETIPFVRVALCRACGVRHPWTPERGWGCPRVVAPQDTTGALAVRLRDAQTVALALALRAVKTRRDNALQVETTARVTAERDEALGRIGRARAIVRDWTHHEDCPARAHNDECGWSDDTHTTWECCGEVSTREACDAAERAECDCDHVRLWDALGGDR